MSAAQHDTNNDIEQQQGRGMIKYLFLGGPLDGQQRATGGCNPYTLRRGQRQHFVYQLHHFTAGPTRRYGVYVLRGNPAPNVAVMRGLIDRHMLEAETMAVRA